jgi:hypothetical protein
MGIVQSDLLIRSAIKAGIREIRDDPTLIDDMLVELLDDPLTKDVYGDLTIAECKKWFTTTDIKVKLGLLAQKTDLPCIAIGIADGTEAESTLGDLDWDGEMQDSTDDPTLQRARFGITFNERYVIQCAAHGEVEKCIFLYSIALFAILRVKNLYLEQRGYMVSKIQLGPLEGVMEEGKELFYSRTISLVGKIRHTWPGDYGTKVTDITSNMVPSAVSYGNTIEDDVLNLAELMDKDTLVGIR